MTRKKSSKNRATNSPAVITSALDDLRPYLNDADFSRLISELEKPLLPALRINPLKVDPHLALSEWKTRYNWQAQNVPYCPCGWWVSDSLVPISQTLEHRLGNYYIQDAASMLPVELFDMAGLEEPLILDMAASPGGKTTHLASNSSDRGLILANDSSHSRLSALKLVLNAWGVTGVMITNFPGEQFGGWFPETFDRILLDAPCSMHNLRSTQARPMRPITPRERQGLSLRQSKLLMSGFQSLKVGGQMVYSTCTLAPEEDEGVLDALLQRWPSCVHIENSSLRLPIPAPALLSAGDWHFHPQVEHAARLWPHIYGTSGFFSALITKVDSVDTSHNNPPQRSLDKTGLTPLSYAENQQLVGMMRDDFGFDLRGVLDSQKLELWHLGSTILAFPVLYLRYFSTLPVLSAGLPLGENRMDDFTPSHEWVTRFQKEFSGGRFSIRPDQITAWLRGEDLSPMPKTKYPQGSTVVVEDESGRFLGRGKVQLNRLKNLLPHRAVL